MNRLSTPLFLLGTFLAILLSTRPTSAQMQIGTNLAEVSAESATPVFVDAFRMATPWKSRSADDPGLDTDKDVKLLRHWPLESPFVDEADDSKHIAYTLIPVYTTGDHTLAVIGKGKIRIEIDGITTDYTLDGQQTIAVPVSITNEGPKQVRLELLESPNSSDRIQDIHFYMPGFDENTIFHPDFIASLTPFDVLRFTDWGRTNSGAHDGESRNDITQQDAPIQAGPKGVAIELMVELANITGKDVWYSVPHSAGQKYIESLASRFRGTTSQLSGTREGGLKEGLKLYVEYSNETWNPKYPQHSYTEAEANNEVDASNKVDDYTAKRSQYIWDLFLQVFAGEFGADAEDWLIFVLASQASDPGVTRARIKALDPNGLQPDVIAIAPYFGRSYIPPRPTLNQVLEDAQEDIDNVDGLVQNHQTAADTIPVVAYAGGQSIVASDNTLADNDPLVERLAEANRDPRMYNLYLDYLNALNGAGMALFNNYNHYERWDADGSWGTLEYLNQPLSEAHKHRAILDWPTDDPTTEPAKDTQPPSDFTLSVTNVTVFSANLEWTQATDDEGVTDYTIYQDGVLVNTVSSEDNKYTITGLISDTDYTFTIEASDAAGNTTASNTVTITTPAPSDDTEPPTAPELRVSDQTATSVSLEWTPATDNDQIAFYYLFQGTELIATIEPPVTNYTAEALAEDTYTFAVKATDRANNASESSNIVVVNISPNSPAIDRESPGAFQITLAEATMDSLTINWTTPTDNRGVVQYVIYLDSMALDTLESSLGSYTFDNLHPDSTYTFTVVAYDASGNTSEATFTAAMPLLVQKLPEAQMVAIQPQKLFSPNNDGQNDTWEIVVAAGYSISTVQIYNRSGRKIFDAGENYPEQPWDGMWQGKPLATGAYYFIITYFNQEGQFTTTGSVALIR